MSKILSPAPATSARSERERRIYCAKHGHSRLRDFFFGYHYCARCGDQLGDSLGGVYSDSEGVYVHHVYVSLFEPENFKTYQSCHCPENAKKLKPKDLKLVPRYNSLGYAMRPPWKPKPGSIAATDTKAAR